MDIHSRLTQGLGNVCTEQVNLCEASCHYQPQVSSSGAYINSNQLVLTPSLNIPSTLSPAPGSQNICCFQVISGSVKSQVGKWQRVCVRELGRVPHLLTLAQHFFPLCSHLVLRAQALRSGISSHLCSQEEHTFLSASDSSAGGTLPHSPLSCSLHSGTGKLPIIYFTK